MINYQIDKNVPLPLARATNAGHELKYFVMKMNIGDSVIVEGKKEADRLSSVIRGLGHKASIRAITGADGAYRVWKMEPVMSKVGR